MQEKLADTLSSYTSLPFCHALLKILRAGFWTFLYLSLPLTTLSNEICFAELQKVITAGNAGEGAHHFNAVTTRDRPPILCFCFFTFFVKELEKNHTTKYFKINSQPLHRSHNEYVKVE